VIQVLTLSIGENFNKVAKPEPSAHFFKLLGFPAFKPHSFD